MSDRGILFALSLSASSSNVSSVLGCFAAGKRLAVLAIFLCPFSSLLICLAADLESFGFLAATDFRDRYNTQPYRHR